MQTNQNPDNQEREVEKVAAMVVPEFQQSKKGYVRIRKYFLNLLLSGDYERLNQALSSYSAQTIESFFTEEGHGVLKQAIIANSIRPLDFVINNVPLQAVKAVFDADGANFLKGLLYIQKMAELSEKNDQQARRLMREKFVLLLKIDRDTVQELMNDLLANPIYVASSTKEDYQAALEICYNQTRALK